MRREGYAPTLRRPVTCPEETVAPYRRQTGDGRRARGKPDQGGRLTDGYGEDADTYEQDEAAAAAEHGAAFRKDIELFVSREAVEACVIRDRHELPPRDFVRYCAFVDPSGGSADSFTLAIAHRERQRVVLDCVQEVRPGFNRSEVVVEFVETLREYRIGGIGGDRHGGAWVAERFREHRVNYEPSEQTKSELYGESLPLLNSEDVELPDNVGLTSPTPSLAR